MADNLQKINSADFFLCLQKKLLNLREAHDSQIHSSLNYLLDHFLQ